MDLTIVVVNFKTPFLVKNLVKSILETVKNLEYEIVVVDNSDIESLRFTYANERVKIVNLHENKGFANANNLGAKGAKGNCLLFLNSDSIVYRNSINLAYDYFLKCNRIGALGIRQLLANGKLDGGCKRGFPTPMRSLYYFSGLSKLFKNSKRFGAYQQTFVDEFDVAEVECISGAFMMLKKKIFDEIGGFDESFFLYGEDVDLCYRLKQKGFRNIYFGKVFFTHLKSRSGMNSVAVLRHFYNSMEIFYNKHYKKKYSVLIEIIIKMAIRLKFILAKRALMKRKRLDNG